MKKFLPVPHSFFFEHIWKSKKKNMKEKKTILEESIRG